MYEWHVFCCYKSHIYFLKIEIEFNSLERDFRDAYFSAVTILFVFFWISHSTVIRQACACSFHVEIRLSETGDGVENEREIENNLK